MGLIKTPRAKRGDSPGELWAKTVSLIEEINNLRIRPMPQNACEVLISEGDIQLDFSNGLAKGAGGGNPESGDYIPPGGPPGTNNMPADCGDYTEFLQTTYCIYGVTHGICSNVVDTLPFSIYVSLLACHVPDGVYTLNQNGNIGWGQVTVSGGIITACFDVMANVSRTPPLLAQHTFTTNGLFVGDNNLVFQFSGHPEWGTWTQDFHVTQPDCGPCAAQTCTGQTIPVNLAVTLG